MSQIISEKFTKMDSIVKLNGCRILLDTQGLS